VCPVLANLQSTIYVVLETSILATEVLLKMDATRSSKTRFSPDPFFYH